MRKFKTISNITVINLIYGGSPYIYETTDVPRVYCKCFNCGEGIQYGMISCPEYREGCCVAHFGYGCPGCKKVFEIKGELEEVVGPQRPFIIEETIGLAIINTRAIRKLRLE